MQLSLSPEVQKQIDDLVRSGQYQTVEQVITAAMVSLHQQEAFADFEPGELDAQLEEAERAIQRGEVMQGDAAFAELRRRHDLRRGRPE
ncbi:MAG TPA: hypothetical protein VM008_20450 [Phycisphaerae bacterium]|nr:hypothetical protein [Phycisphaerae bacterium]